MARVALAQSRSSFWLAMEEILFDAHERHHLDFGVHSPLRERLWHWAHNRKRAAQSRLQRVKEEAIQKGQEMGELTDEDTWPYWAKRIEWAKGEEGTWQLVIHVYDPVTAAMELSHLWHLKPPVEEREEKDDGNSI
jgi:hypothetical protein